MTPRNLAEEFMFDLAFKNAKSDTKQFAAYVFQCCGDVELDTEREEVIRLALEAVKKAALLAKVLQVMERGGG